MIIRLLLIYLWVFMLDASCQSPNKVNANHLFDTDSVNFGIIYSVNGEIDSTIYFDLNGKRHHVLFTAPEYENGYENFKHFQIEQFRKLIKDDEVNGVALVYIFISGNKIKEIRISKRIGYKCIYDPMIKKTIMMTQDKWIFPKEIDQKEILFTYLFHLQ